MMMVSDPKYKMHGIFGELDFYIEFYENLAFSVLRWVSGGTGSLTNIDTYLFSSVQGTLSSIHQILGGGKINDAYALLRKFYDLAIANVYANLYLEEQVRAGSLIAAQIDDWRRGKAKLPEYRIMSQYIRASKRLMTVSDLLHHDDRYKRLRARCNDHTHYNYFKNVILNDGEIRLPERGAALQQIADDIRDLFVLHFVYLFTVMPHYMMSSDYVDSLDCGLEPQEGSEYWVAPFIQQAFDEVVTRHRPDLAAAIRTGSAMQLN